MQTQKAVIMLFFKRGKAWMDLKAKKFQDKTDSLELS
jgi:hypothetical protein